jgi:hypothetical protein
MVVIGGSVGIVVNTVTIGDGVAVGTGVAVASLMMPLPSETQPAVIMNAAMPARRIHITTKALTAGQLNLII